MLSTKAVLSYIYFPAVTNFVTLFTADNQKTYISIVGCKQLMVDSLVLLSSVIDPKLVMNIYQIISKST